MSVGAVSASPLPSLNAATASSATSARAADGDYKAANASTSQVADKDGDYKSASAATSSPVAQASASVQLALTSLKKGG